MIEADILLRGRDPIEPIMAHPPENDSDITLQEWLKEVTASGKGIKLDFKRLREHTNSPICILKILLKKTICHEGSLLCSYHASS